MNLENLIKLSYTKFVKLLTDKAAEEKVRAMIKAGKKDGYPDDEKIVFSSGTTIARNLKPCQKQILLEKSIKWAIIGKDIDTVRNVISGKPTEINGNAIVTLNGKYILDGTHRWIEAFAVNPNARLVTYNMEINIEPIEALKIIQLAIAANTKDIPFSSSDGTNLYTVSENAFKTFIKKNITKAVLELLVKTEDEAADYFWNNVLLLRKSNQPIKNAPDRVYMPQTAKSPGFEKSLEDGEIDFKKPFAKKENRIPTFDKFISE